MRIWHCLRYVLCIEQPFSINVSAASETLVFPYPYPMLCSSSNTILQSTSFKGLTCITYYSQFVFNPNPKTGRAISFILDDARHKKRGCADHPAKLGLTQLPEPVGQLWTESWMTPKPMGTSGKSLLCISSNYPNEIGLFCLSPLIFTTLFKPYLCIVGCKVGLICPKHRAEMAVTIIQSNSQGFLIPCLWREKQFSLDFPTFEPAHSHYYFGILSAISEQCIQIEMNNHQLNRSH